MINVTLNYDRDQVEIEGDPTPIHFSQLDQARQLIIKVLHKAFYAGEAICLEEKRNNKYSEVERW